MKRFFMTALALAAVTVLVTSCAREKAPSPSTSVDRTTAPAKVGGIVRGTPDDPMPVIMTTDTDTDEPLAVLYLLKNENIDVKGVVTTGNGYLPSAVGAPVYANLLESVGRSDIPVLYGPTVSITPVSDYPASWVTTGIAAYEKTGLTNSGKAQPATADGVQFIIDTVKKSARRVSFLISSGATPVALALQRDPSITENIQQIVFSGGAFDVPGNNFKGRPPDTSVDTPWYKAVLARMFREHAAEYNVFTDAGALSIVLRSGVSVIFSPLDAANGVPLTTKTLRVDELQKGGDTARLVANLAAPLLGEVAEGVPGIDFWDPVAASLLVTDTCEDLKRGKVLVNLNYDGRFGKTTLGNEGSPAQVCMKVDAQAFYSDFYDAIASY